MNRFEGAERLSRESEEQPRAVEKLFSKQDEELVRNFVNDTSRKVAWRRVAGRYEVRLSESQLESAMAYLEGRDKSNDARSAFVRTWLLADSEARDRQKGSLPPSIPSSLSSGLSAGLMRKSNPKPSLDDYDRRLR
jgi:hypothetical protein